MNPAAPPVEPVLTVAETARVLKMSITTVYTLIRDGRLRASRPGGQWRVRRSAIQDLLDETEGTHQQADHAASDRLRLVSGGDR